MSTNTFRNNKNPPISLNIWEATRFTPNDILPKKVRDAALVSNANALTKFSEELGAEKILALMHPGFIRWLSSDGLRTKQVGPILRDAEKQKICVIQIQIK